MKSDIKAHKNSIHLIVQYYRCATPERQAEIDTCLRNNLLNPYLTAIHLLTEEQFDLSQFPNHDKIVQTVIGERLTFERAFQYVNETDSEGQKIWALSNADIYFDETLKFVDWKNLEGVVYALTRHEVQADGSIQLVDAAFAHGCQDAWFFRNPLPLARMFTSFPLGVSGCDGRIAHEFIQVGLKVINPSLKVTAYHFDLMGEPDIFKRNTAYAKLMTQENFEKGGAVPPPYQYYLYPVDQVDPSTYEMYRSYMHQLTSLGVRPAELCQQLEDLDRKLAELSRQLGEKEQRVIDLAAQLKKSEAEIKSLLKSLSWKVTKPLRSLHALLSRKEQ